MDYEVSFIKVVDAVLAYHRERCVDMHLNENPDGRQAEYYKAEAAREIIMAIAKTLLHKKDVSKFQVALQQRVISVFDSVFFDSNMRRRLKGGEGNGGK